MHCRFRLLVFTHDAARGTNDFLWGIFCLQNPTVRAGFQSRNPTIRALVFTHDAARSTNDFLWEIFCLQNSTVRAGSASQLKRGTVVGQTDAHTCCNYESYSHRSTYRSQIKLSKLNRISLTQEMMQMYLHHMNEEEMGPKRFSPKNKF